MPTQPVETDSRSITFFFRNKNHVLTLIDNQTPGGCAEESTIPQTSRLLTAPRTVRIHLSGIFVQWKVGYTADFRIFY